MTLGGEGEAGPGDPVGRGGAGQKMLQERPNVLDALPQGGQFEGDDAQPIIEVIPKATAKHQAPEILATGGHDPHLPARPLQPAQEARLTTGGEFPHLIHQEAAAPGREEGPVQGRHGIFLSQTGDPHHLEGAVPPGTEPVNLPRQAFLAGPVLADQEQAGIRDRHEPGGIEEPAKGRRVTDQSLGPGFGHDLLHEISLIVSRFRSLNRYRQRRRHPLKPIL